MWIRFTASECMYTAYTAPKTSEFFETEYLIIIQNKALEGIKPDLYDQSIPKMYNLFTKIWQKWKGRE